MKDYEKELINLIPEDMVYEKQTLSNDFIFGKTMQNKELCVELITMLTGNEIDDSVTINNQKPVKITSDSKGVRYDVYVEDLKNSYDAEMQNYNSLNDLPRRSRYYQGLMDLNLLESGKSYKQLKDSYIIFICTYDPFGKSLCCYEFENTCINDTNLALEDGRTILMFNTKGTIVNVSNEIKEFLDYIETKTATNDFLSKLDNEVEKVKQNKEWRIEYMKTWIRDMDIREDGYADGLAEGLELGKQSGEDKLGKLICKLLEAGCDQDEIMRVSTDSEYRKEKFKEYEI